MKKCVDCGLEIGVRKTRCTPCNKLHQIENRKRYYEKNERPKGLGTCTCGKPAISPSSRGCAECLLERKRERMRTLRKERDDVEKSKVVVYKARNNQKAKPPSVKLANDRRVDLNIRIMTDIERYYISGRENVARALNWLYFGKDFRPDAYPAQILTGNKAI